MPPLRVVDSGALFVNPNPAYQHVASFFPNMVQLSADELICTYQRGDGMYAVNSNIALLRSADGGATWQDEGFLHDTADDDRPYSYHATFISRMSDGTLVVSPFRVDRSDPEQQLFSESGGLVANEQLLLTSKDGGHSWSEPQIMPLRDGNPTWAQSVIELVDGRWLGVFDCWPAYDDPAPYKPLMITMTSTDRGVTWQDRAVMADGADGGKGFWHGRPIRLADDTLHSLLWSADMRQPDKGPVDLPTHFVRGDASGTNWETPEPTPLTGQTISTAQLTDGRLAALYTWREAEQPGFMLALSDTSGEEWDVHNQIRLWDATGQTHIGIDSAEKYPRSHDMIAFGAPSLIALESGDLLASWWCTDKSITHPRWARVAVDD